MKTRTTTSSTAVLFLVLLSTFVSDGALAQDRKKTPASYSVIEGTVFRDPGFALPQATVVLIRKADSTTGKAASKEKKLNQTETTFRGEFSFRVPAERATYILKASHKGLGPQSKEVEIKGEENQEVSIVLFPESK